jgi:hypothetical protein
VPPDPMLLDHLSQHGVAIDAGPDYEGDRLHRAFIVQVRSVKRAHLGLGVPHKADLSCCDPSPPSPPTQAQTLAHHVPS